MATVTINIDTDYTGERSMNIARKSVSSLSTAVLALGPAFAPVAAAGVAAFAGLASTLGGATVAVGVFKAAVQPQMAAVQEAAAAQEKYNQAVAQYGKDSEQAKSAQAAMKTQMEGMPKATQDTAKAFVGLKSDFSAWSDSLAGDTMPIFTKGIGVLRTILPTLTPIVQNTAKVFGDLMDRLKTKVESPSFEEFMKKVADWSASGLKKTVDGVIGLGKAVGGFLMSDGFKEFLALGKEAGGNIGDILKKLAQFALEFVQAAGPMAGLSFAALGILADVLNAIPQEVLEILAPTILAIAAAMKLWNLGLLAYTTYQNLANMAALGFPAVWIVGAIAGIIAIIVLIATKTTWFQDLWKVTWEAIKTAAKVVWEFLRDSVFKPLGDFFTKTIPGWAETLQKKVIGAWDAIKSGVKIALDFLKNLFLNWTGPGLIIKHWDKIKEGARKGVDKIKEFWNGFMDFFRKIPGKISSAASGMWDGIKSAFKGAVNGIIRSWNNLSFTIGGGSIMGVDIPKVTLGTPNIPYLARGGITGSKGLAMVGERGRELVNLPGGSHVRTNADTERILRGRGGGESGVQHIHLHMGDREIGEWIIDPMRGAVRRRGGLERVFGG